MKALYKTLKDQQHTKNRGGISTAFSCFGVEGEHQIPRNSRQGGSLYLGTVCEFWNIMQTDGVVGSKFP